MAKQSIFRHTNLLEKAVYPGPAKYEVKYNREEALTVLTEAHHTLNTATLIIDKTWITNEKEESDLLHSLANTVEKITSLLTLIRSGQQTDTSFRTLADIRNIEDQKQKPNNEITES